MRHGLEPDQDQIYLRFLFRLGQSRDEGQTLLEAFEALLLQLGFAVLHEDDEEETEEEIMARGRPPGSDNEGDTSLFEGPGRRRSRRASFSSFYDAEDKSTKPRVRASSRASLSRLQDNSQGFGSKKFTTKKTTRQETAEHPGNRNDRTRDDRRLRDSKSQEDDVRERRQQTSKSQKGPTTASKSSTNGSRRRQHRAVPDVFVYQDTNASDEDSHSQDLAEQNPRPSQAPVPIELLYYPSQTQLLRDADTFEHFSIRRVARKMIRKWRDIALEACRSYEDMDQRAVEYDQEALVRQAFDQWHQQFRVRRQEAETERFFLILERRAGKARDLYLLTKAFTHWAACATEQVADNAVARRHIIRFRYFNAWKEVTAVNELKVRRFIVKRFFAVWKQRYNHAPAKDHAAITLYQGNLVEKIYWRWFWEFCERRAPEWRIARLKRRYFFQWMAATRSNLIKENRVADSRESHLKQNFLTRWIEKARTLRAQKQEAIEFKRRQTVANALPVWKMQLRHAPLGQQVTAMVNHRVVSTAFHTLVRHYNLEYQAEEFKRKRIASNTWKAWNYKLRYQTLRNQISDRLAMQALYKWVIAERGILVARMHDERLKRQTLQTLADRLRKHTARYELNHQAIGDSRNIKTLGSAMKKWRSKLKTHEERNKMAFEFDTPRITQESLHIWYARQSHLTQLKNWAAEAAYYFRAKKSIIAWRAAVVDTQKQKVRNAYSRVRRKHKMNFARGLLSKWRDKTNHIHSLNEAARDIIEQRTKAQVPLILSQWQSRFSQIVGQKSVAVNRSQGAQLTTILQTWSTQLQHIQEINSQAQSFDLSRLEKPTNDCFRKLRLRALEIHTLDSRANSVYLWNERRRGRGCLSIWYEKTGQKILSKQPDLDNEHHFQSSLLLRGTRTPRVPRRGPSIALSNMEEVALDTQTDTVTSQSHQSPLGSLNPDSTDWIPPPPPTDRQPFTTPSYLNTPSKRAARARALVLGTTFRTGATTIPPPILETKLESTTPASPSRQSRRGGIETPRVSFRRVKAVTESRAGISRPGGGRDDELVGGNVRRSLFDRK